MTLVDSLILNSFPGMKAQLVGLRTICTVELNKHFSSFSSVFQSSLTLCDPMNRGMPGLPVHHQLLEFTQTHIHRVSYILLNSSPVPFLEGDAEVNIFNTAFFWLVLSNQKTMESIIFHLFCFSLFVFMYLKFISYKQHVFVSCFFISSTSDLLACLDHLHFFKGSIRKSFNF